MGIFDIVQVKFRCPVCEFIEAKHDWQTKDLECSLHLYEVGDMLTINDYEIGRGWIEIHTCCPNCDNYICAKIKVADYVLTDVIKYVKWKRDKK